MNYWCKLYVHLSIMYIYNKEKRMRSVFNQSENKLIYKTICIHKYIENVIELYIQIIYVLIL